MQLLKNSLLQPETQAETLGILVEKCQEYHHLWRLEMVVTVVEILYDLETKHH